MLSRLRPTLFCACAAVLATGAHALAAQNQFSQALQQAEGKVSLKMEKPVQVGEFVFHSATLQNGLRAMAVQDTTPNKDGGAPTASIFVIIGAGNRDESAATTGLAHLTEHALYTGTATTGTDEHDRIVKRELGAESNAFTREDYTLYYDHGIPATALPRVLAMEADRMANLLFEEASVLHERERLRSEEAYTWQPSTTRGEQLENAVYRKEGYRHGLRDEKGHTMAPGIDVGPIYEFYSTYYRPDNAAVVVVTPGEPSAVLMQIAEAFEGWKVAGNSALAKRAQEKEPMGPRTARFASQLAQDRVEFCWVVPQRTHQDAAGLALLGRMLDRRDTTAGEPFQVSYLERQGSGLFTIAATGKTAYQELDGLMKDLNDNGASAEEVAAAVVEERDRFLNLPLRARPYFSLAADMGRTLVYGEEQWIASYHKSIDAAGDVGVDQVIQRWLNPKRRVVVQFTASADATQGIELPKKSGELAKYAQEAMESGEYQKTVVAYTELLNRKPDKMNTVIYLYYRGSMHMDHKNYDEAIADFETALKVTDYPAVRDALEEAKRLRDKVDGRDG